MGQVNVVEDLLFSQAAGNGFTARCLPSMDRERPKPPADTSTTHQAALDTIADMRELVIYMLFLVREVPEHICSDNGPEFTSRAVRGWLSSLGVKAMFIEPGSPWENGYVGSFNGKFRDELLNREVFSTLTEARILHQSSSWPRQQREASHRIQRVRLGDVHT